MVKILLNETIKYRGVLYYANSEIEVEDRDAEEISQYGEILEGITPTPVVDEKERARVKRKSK